MKTCLNHARLLCPLLAVVGLAQSSLAQNTTAPDRQPKPAQTGTPAATPHARGESGNRMTRTLNGADGVDFRSAKWMKGRDILNTNNQSIGDVSDLIIDRGSGKVRYVIVKTGTTLGMGGRSVALPYSQFTLDASKSKLILNTSADQLNQYPEFTDDSWNNLRTSTYGESGRDDSNMSGNDSRIDSTNRTDATNRDNPDRDTATGNGSSVNPGKVTASGRKSGEVGANTDAPHNFNDWMWSESAPYRGDTYGSSWDSARKEKIEGEVKKISRESSPHGEDVVVEVAAQDGTTKKVALGPAWFVAGGETAINRGDKISLEVMPIYVATSTSVNGRNMALRDEKGAGVWSGRSFGAGKDSYSAPYYRHVRLSSLMGATVDCRGTECGTVNDLVIESNSGTLAFVSIDPNQNFLGIADTKRMVPWSIVTVGMNNRVRVDAVKDMILASPETPSDLATLNGQGRTDSIYNAYQVPARSSDSYRSNTDQSNWNSGWGSDKWNSNNANQSDRHRANPNNTSKPSDPNNSPSKSPR